jgi:hypothetical protein
MWLLNLSLSTLACIDHPRDEMITQKLCIRTFDATSPSRGDILLSFLGLMANSVTLIRSESESESGEHSLRSALPAIEMCA